MDLVFTDLDGTLLDPEDYSWKAAAAALKRLEERGVPVIIVTSKTRAEVEPLRSELGNREPFIVENGGALFIPKAYFHRSVPNAKPRNGYEVLEFGSPYEELVRALEAASLRAGVPVKGLSSMTVEEIVAATQLSREGAMRAAQREYDEPFQILDPSRAGELIRALEDMGYHWTQGSRFYHVCGNNDKGRSVRELKALFQREGHALRCVGLGDSYNDLPFLREMDIAGIVNSRHSAELMAALPNAIGSALAGAAGWNEIILKVIP